MARQVEMSPWAVFALCALTLGASAYSPIPEMDFEMETFNLAMRNPAFRLPTTTRPKHYDLMLTPYFENAPTPFSFDGAVTINIISERIDVTEIVMHCNDLTIGNVVVRTSVDGGAPTQVPTDGVLPTCDPVYDFMRINLLQAMVQNQEYAVQITYRGNMQTNMRGFYRSWYVDSTGNKRWMATTQFQPGHARQAFPCYDEPGFKATFDITIVRETGFSPSISNMPIRGSSSVSPTRIADFFHTTPEMSTYLIAFIVSHYTVAESTPEGDPRPFQVIARDNIGTTGEWAKEVGVELLEYMEEYTDIPYYTMTDNMDMKQVAIPDFSAGAMENWGLLTYREALILYDPDNSNHFYRQRVANIVSHEIAHMWFGNLVTCDWWNNLWLNEGFARFYQYYLTGAVRPELGYENRFITEQLQVSMLSDSVDSAHALSHPNVNTPAEVSSHFSTITYARGASVIRMTQHLLGDATFHKGCKSYLKFRSFDVSTPQHLFDELDAAAVEDRALVNYPGITISNYFKTWSEKAGHPILNVLVDHQTGQIAVIQTRWERDTGVSQFPSLWQVPITWTRQLNADFANTKPSQVLTEQVTFINRGSIGHEWVIFNKQATGFYKVNYDPTTWGLITLALRGEDRSIIHEYNRAQIVDDVFQFARAGVMTYTRAFNILSFLEFETEYAPWMAAITGLNFVRRRLAYDSDSLQELDDMILQWSTAVVARLGYADIPGEDYMDGLLRMYLMTFLCNVGDAQCNAAAVTNFQALRATPSTPVPPNMRPWVYCGGLRNSDNAADDYNFLWERYLSVDLAGEKIVLLEALGCTPDAASIAHYLTEVYTDNDNVRPQDYSTALNSATTGNEENTWSVFQWLQSSHELVINELGTIATPLNTIGQRLLSEEAIQEFEEWLDENLSLPGIATGRSAANTARNNLAWSERRLPELTGYFENGYVDFEPVLPPTDPPIPPTEAPPVTDQPPDPGSANIASVGFATLLITLLVNLINY